MIFDSHAHYDDSSFDTDREEVIDNLWKNNIDYVINIGVSREGSRSSVLLAEKYENIYSSIGMFPSDTGDMTMDDISCFEKLASSPKVVAIGEIGLDYHYESPCPEVQKEWFSKQINLARKLNLPVIYHSRDAAKDTLDIVKAEKASDMGGVIHCFSYSTEIAKEYLDMGFFLGIGGVVTFKNGRKLREVVEYMPLSQMVLETDCPYLAPEPFRGKRNSSIYIPYIAAEVARIKNVSEEEIYRVTSDNAKRLFRIGK